jgi:putative GTP pyrophosphokinase
MEQIYKPTDSELKELRNIKIANAIFLKLVEDALKQVTEENKIIFRRIPDSRLKTSKSILKKYSRKENSTKEFIPFVKGMNDIAGLRMTITTKDEFELAKKILLASASLKKFGELDTESREENGIMNKRGYSAHHYYLKYTIRINDEDEQIGEVIADTLKRARISKNELAEEYSGIAEIQVRTLAQDLWAVFEHPERYKSDGEIPETLNKELLNYARLMDVADDIAQLTKNRKVYEAESYAKKKKGNVPVGGSKKLLTIELFRQEFEKIFSSKKRDANVNVTTFELCDLLMQLADWGIFTLEDLIDLTHNEIYLKAIQAAFDKLSIKPEEMEIAIADSFQLFFICRICQTECEYLDNKPGDQKKAVEQRLEEREYELTRKIKEIKEESDLMAVINNYEVK